MLLEGKTYNSIRCLDIDFESGREEPFFDLSLSIKGCRTLDDCFKAYTQEEILDGDNKYRAEGHGLQRASKVPFILLCFCYYFYLSLYLLSLNLPHYS